MNLDLEAPWPLPDVVPTNDVLGNIEALASGWRDARDLSDLDAMRGDVTSPTDSAERGLRAAWLVAVEDCLRFHLTLAACVDIDGDDIEAAGVDSWDMSALGLRHECDCASGCDLPECDYLTWRDRMSAD